MKKILTSVLVASLMLLGTSAFAQVSVGAGYVNGKYNYANSNSKYSQNANGFYAGLEYNVPVGEVLGISAGVNYEMLMSKDYNLYSISGNLKEQYINVPVRLNIGANLGDSRVFFFGGPTMSYALSSKAEVGVAGITGSVDLYDKDILKNRFDVMVGAGVGIDLMERFRVTVGYDFGMFNKLDDGDDSASTKFTRDRLPLSEFHSLSSLEEQFASVSVRRPFASTMSSSDSRT